MTADQIAQLPGRTGIAQLNFQDTSWRGEQFGVDSKGATFYRREDMAPKESTVFLGNLSSASLFGLRIPGFGLSGDDLASGAGEVAAHEIGHRIGFDVVPASAYRFSYDNLMTEGMGNPSASNPLYFKPTKDDRRAIDEINKIGDNTPPRKQ